MSDFGAVPVKYSQEDSTTATQNPTTAGALVFEGVMNTLEFMLSTGTALVRSSVAGVVRKLASTNNDVQTVMDLIRAVSPLSAAGASLPGAANIAGRVRYQLPNAAGTLVNAALAVWTMTTVTAGAEIAKLGLQVIQAGAAVEALSLTPTTVDGETFAILAGRLGGVAITRKVLIGADTTGPGGANRALYVAT